MSDILVYSDKKGTATELVSKAREFAGGLGLDVCAAVLGSGAREWAEELGGYGADRVYVSEDSIFEGLPADVMASAVAQLAREVAAEYVLIGSTRRGKEVAPRVAQVLGAGCVTDVNTMDVEDGALIGGRYAYGGATIAMESIDTPVKVFAVMPKTFEAREPTDEKADIIAAALDLEPSPVKLVDSRPKEGEAVNLEEAERIVGIGRGIQKKEDVRLGEDLAAALSAELACTKGLADFQWMAEERVIGLSGEVAKPDVYVAAGISGQIQHTVGISGAKLIVAINSDKEAPIFQLADYGIVGDLYEVVPALVETLKKAQ